MSIREEQCNKVCRILDDVLANRPTERDSLIVATRNACSALSEPHWIPCSERLPEMGDYVICAQENGDVGEGKLLPDGNWLILYESAEYGPRWVRAWMSLPEPYEERRER